MTDSEKSASKPDLEGAYALNGADDVRRLYADWAGTYDSGFATARGYQLPALVAAGYAEGGGKGSVLDVGAGTGLVGEALAAQGVGPIEGTDLSAEMLAVAQSKGVYGRTFTSDLMQPLPIEDNTYQGITSAGTFTLGHLGPEPLSELIRITAPGGLFALSINAEHWNAAGFGTAFERLAAQVADLTRAPIPIYTKDVDHEHAADLGYLVRFRVR